MPCSAGQNSLLYNFPAIGVDGSGNYTGLNVKQFSLTKVVSKRREGTSTIIGGGSDEVR